MSTTVEELDVSEYMPPVYASAEDERRHRKASLVVAFRLFAAYGFDEGAAGHITARDPELTDHFWVNPLGVNFGSMGFDDLLLVDSTGRIVEGRRPVNRAAFAIHSQVHELRPDVVAAAHSHSMYGKAWSALGRHLDPITQDACAFFDDHGVYEDFGGAVLTTDEGRRLATALASHKAVILQNHGLLTVGPNVESCTWWFVAMERSCQAQLLADAAGTPRILSPDLARETYATNGTPGAGWVNAMPLWQRMFDETPALRDLYRPA